MVDILSRNAKPTLIRTIFYARQAFPAHPGQVAQMGQAGYPGQPGYVWMASRGTIPPKKPMKTQIASTNVNAQPTSQNNSAAAANGQSALLRQLTAALGKRLAQVAQSAASNPVSSVSLTQNPADTRISRGEIVNS